MERLDAEETLTQGTVLSLAWAQTGVPGQTVIQMRRSIEAPAGQREAYLKLIEALRGGQGFDAFMQSLTR